MNASSFRDLLLEHLVPMFSGTELGDAVVSLPRHALAAFDRPCTLLLKPTKDARFRFAFTRSQPFAPNEKRLVELFIAEVSALADQSGSAYFQDLMATVPRRVISRFLPGARGRTTLENALQSFESLAAQTYEGRPVVAALGLTGSRGYGRIRLDELWKEDFSAVLSNGFDSMYLCGSDGRVFNLAFLPSPKVVTYSPYRLGSIAGWCNESQRVALVLNRNGEVLVFKNQMLQFAKRRGAWRYYAHESVVKRLGVGDKKLRRAIYESCLDVSFARTGGCLAVLTSKAYPKRATEVVPQNDFVDTRGNTRTKLLSQAVKKPFQSLDRRLRQELLSLDGATVLKHTGDLVTAGSIVKVPGGSTGGGRRAAAIQLSSLGLGIKVSADGPIAGFRNREEIFAL